MAVDRGGREPEATGNRAGPQPCCWARVASPAWRWLERSLDQVKPTGGLAQG